jgi:hypothetical protein
VCRTLGQTPVSSWKHLRLVPLTNYLAFSNKLRVHGPEIQAPTCWKSNYGDGLKSKPVHAENPNMGNNNEKGFGVKGLGLGFRASGLGFLMVLREPNGLRRDASPPLCAKRTGGLAAYASPLQKCVGRICGTSRSSQAA